MSSEKPHYFCPGSPSGHHELDGGRVVKIARDDHCFPSGVWYQVRCRACGRDGKILIRDCQFTWDAPEGV